MVRTKAGKQTTGPRLALPDLVDFDGDYLEPSRDYDAVLFADRAFAGQDASDARFLECRIERCDMEGLTMSRARIVDCELVDLFGPRLELAGSTWRNSEMTGGRLGVLTLAGAGMTSIRLHGVKLGFVNLSGARLEDVVFEDCEIGSLNAGAGHLRSVSFPGSSISELNVDEATLAKVDLSGAKLRALIGVENLRGAIIGHQQLLDLAPLFAAQLGVAVRPEE